MFNRVKCRALRYACLCPAVDFYKLIMMMMMKLRWELFGSHICLVCARTTCYLFLQPVISFNLLFSLSYSCLKKMAFSTHQHENDKDTNTKRNI